ncbi:GHKL domain-containing protein [Alloscardovia venturai]|uniref:GHKL domain-containing protein n=1 Tax=Alloscardovia venturai TaxID=1769421 RepID=A0ABW2YA37_9BIFI
MQTLLDFLWPGSLWALVFPSTFTVYLCGCVLVFSKALLWREWSGNQWRWLLFVAFLCFTTVLNGPVIYNVGNGQVKDVSYFPLIAELVLLIAGLWLVTRSSLLIVTVTAAIGYSLEHVVADIVQILGILFTGDSQGRYFLNPYFKVMVFFVYLITSLLVWWFMGRKTLVNEDAVRSSKWWIAVCIAVFAFVIFANGIGTGLIRNRYLIENHIDLFRGYGLLLFIYDAVCSVAVLTTLLVVSSRNRLLREVEVMHDINRRQQQHYELSQEYRDIINMKMHDLKKIISTDNAVNLEKSPRVQRVLDGTLKMYDAIFDTGSEAVDAILNDKSLYCAQRGIGLQCLVDGKVLQFMEDADIYSLVGNIMDNAVEAVEDIASDTLSKTISLQISRQGGMVLINEINQFDGEIRRADDVLETSKGSRIEHGFGMQSMHYVVDEYDGRMTFTAKDHIFELTILIPIPFTK